MNSNFAGTLKKLRLENNLSLEGLARLTDVSRQMIHRYEQNEKSPSTTTLLKISDALKVHPSKFFHEGDISITIDNVNFREEESLVKQDFNLENLKNECINYLERFIELENLLGNEVKFSNPLAGIKISNKKDIEKAAKSLRKRWKLGNAPIADVTQIVENNHISVFEVEILEQFTGLSGYANDEIPFIVINSNCNDLTRKRFTILHELAHIVLEWAESLQQPKIERLCNHFAGAVLLVDDVLKEEIGRGRTKISLRELVALKEKYGISVKAIIVRAKVTNLISYGTGDEWWQNYDEWYKAPNDNQNFGSYISKEKPSRFNMLLTRGIKEKRLTWNKAANLKNTKIDILKKEFDELEFVVS